MKRLATFVTLAAAWLLVWCATAAGASYNVYVCGPWSSDAGPFVGAAVPHTTFGTVACGGGVNESMYLEGRATAQSTVPNGQGASWTTTAPPGLSITHIYTVNDAGDNVGNGKGWWGEFFWNGGPGPAGRSSQIDTNNFFQYGCCQASFNNQTVGWFIACGVVMHDVRRSARRRGRSGCQRVAGAVALRPIRAVADLGLGSRSLSARVLRGLAIGRL